MTANEENRGGNKGVMKARITRRAKSDDKNGKQRPESHRPERKEPGGKAKRAISPQRRGRGRSRTVEAVHKQGTTQVEQAAEEAQAGRARKVRASETKGTAQTEGRGSAGKSGGR